MPSSGVQVVVDDKKDDVGKKAELFLDCSENVHISPAVF